MLPQIDGVNWKPYQGLYRADVSKVLWRYEDSDHLDPFRAGITIGRDRYGAYAEFDPSIAPENLTIFYLDKLREKHSDFTARTARTARTAARRKKEASIRERRDTALERARASKSVWGQFTSGYTQITDLAGRSYLVDVDKDKLDRYVRDTQSRAAKMMADARTIVGGVDWTDDLVVEALMYMTNLDSDERALRTKPAGTSCTGRGGIGR